MDIKHGLSGLQRSDCSKSAEADFSGKESQNILRQDGPIKMEQFEEDEVPFLVETCLSSGDEFLSSSYASEEEEVVETPFIVTHNSPGSSDIVVKGWPLNYVDGGEPLTWQSHKTSHVPIPFSGKSGLKVLPQEETARGYFDLVANSEFYDLILSETNRQAQNVLLRGNMLPRARAGNWKELNLEEFQTWLGLLFHMGHIQMGNIQHYWKTDFLFKNDIFSQFMSRDRFLGILQALNLSENLRENDPIFTDRLFRIKPLVEWFNSRMATIFYPDRVLIIDESMILRRGKLVFRQSVEGERHKSDVKLYVLNDSRGFTLRIIIYAGTTDAELGASGHRSKVVKKLLNDFVNRGHSVFMGHYYNSVQLTQELLLLKTYSTGTLRPNSKGIPLEVVQSNLKSGEIVSRYSGSICVAKWKHKRDVLFVSSQFGDELVDVPTRKSVAFKPKALVECNKYLEDLNYEDQLFVHYSCEKVTLKWYKKIGIHIFQIVLLNSYLLYKKNCPDGFNSTFFDFRMEVIKSLLGPLLKRKRRRSELPESYGSHFPELSPLPEHSSRRIQKRCRNCQKKGIRKQVTFICPDCTDEPGLCLRPCFQEYHSTL